MTSLAPHIRTRITDIFICIQGRRGINMLSILLQYAANDDCNCTTQCVAQKLWAPCDNSPRCFLCIQFYCFSEDAVAKCCFGCILLILLVHSDQLQCPLFQQQTSGEHTGVFRSWRGRDFLQGFETELKQSKYCHFCLFKLHVKLLEMSESSEWGRAQSSRE